MAASFTRFPSLSRRIRLSARPAWLAARATNVLRRRKRLAGASFVAFALIFALYLLLPAGAAGLRVLTGEANIELPDTAAIALRLRVAQRELRNADSTLLGLRQERSESSVDSPFQALSARDSLTRSVSELASLLQRASNAPLPDSYRALGNFSELVSDPRVLVLLDSLSGLERARETLGTGGAIDPRFLALTSQANEVGLELQELGHRRLSQLREEVAELNDYGVVGSARDSIALAARDEAALRVASNEAQMQTALRAISIADSLTRLENERTRLASLPVLLLAAIVLSTFIAFGIEFMDEMRSPRVADAVEAERLTNQRVLTVVGARAIPADRARRAADRSLAPALDPTADGYRILAWHLNSRWPADGIVTVAGDEPHVAATIGANLAAVFAIDARATLLVDTDLERGPVAEVLGLPETLGLGAVLESRRKWSEALVPVEVGRSRTMDVLPVGEKRKAAGSSESPALIAVVLRAARRHDATIVVSPGGDELRKRVGDDVVLCATAGVTRLATLARAVATLVDVGGRVRGIVMWEGALPEIPSRTGPAGSGSAT